MSHLLYSGLEDLGLVEEGAAGDVAGDVVAEVAEIRAEVAEATAEIQEQGEVLDEVAEQLVEVAEGQEEVIALVEGMESMLTSGNFDGLGFAALYNQTQAVCAKKLFGATDRGASRLGAEDLFDASTAAVNARDGMEGFMDKVKGAGSSVVAFIKKIFNTIVTFFVGLFNKTKALKRRIETLTADLSKSDFKVKEKIKLGGWNGYIDYANKSLTGKSGEVAEAADGLKAYTGLLDGKIGLSEFTSAYTGLVNTMKSKLGSAGASKDEKGTQVAQIAGIRIVFHHGEGSPTDFKKAAELARGLSIKTAKAENFSKLTTGEAAPKLTNAGALKTVLVGVGAHLTRLENAKVDQNFNEAKRNKLIGHLNANATSEDKEIKDQEALIKAVVASSANMSRAIGALATSFLEAQINGVAAHI